MRGKVSLIGFATRVKRITPAHAGKSNRSWSEGGLTGDHPRTCGEKHLHLSTIFQHSGSPPHMRGKAEHFYTFIKLIRITPAHAGKRIRYVYTAD